MTRPSDGADRAQDQAVVGLVAFGAHHEEDRQRDPEAVLVHVEEPVGGDAGGQGGAEADRVAGALGVEGEVGAQRRDRLPPAPGPFRLVGGAVGGEPDDQRPGDLGEAAEGAVEERRPGVARRQEEALGDQHRQRHREADDRQPQRDAEAVAGEQAEQAEREHRGRPGWLLRMPSAAAMPISGAAAACQAARGRAGASIPGKPVTRAPVAIAPWVGASKPSSTTRASPIGTASRKPRRIAGPGSAGPIAKSGEARSRRAVPAALKSGWDDWPDGTGVRVT